MVRLSKLELFRVTSKLEHSVAACVYCFLYRLDGPLPNCDGWFESAELSPARVPISALRPPPVCVSSVGHQPRQTGTGLLDATAHAQLSRSRFRAPQSRTRCIAAWISSARDFICRMPRRLVPLGAALTPWSGRVCTSYGR